MSYFRKTTDQAFGLEIGTSTIKAVSLAAGMTLQQAAMTPTPVGSMRDGSVVDPNAVANAIRKLLSDSGISQRNVITAIPNQAAITRNIMIPRMEVSELRKSDVMRFEAERYIPYPIDEVTMDYHLLDNPASIPADGRMEVVLAAVPNDVVNRQLEAVRLAGLTPVIVDVKNFAAMRTVAAQNRLKDEVTLVLEVGASTTFIGLMRGDRLLMSRNISVSADNFTEALQKTFALDFSAAEALKMSYVAPTASSEGSAQGQDPSRVTEALRPVIINLITEVRRSIEFYNVQQDANAIIDQVILVGGGAKLSGLSAALGEAFGLPVEVINLWNNVSGTIPESIQTYGPEFAVAFGLAMRGVNDG